MHLLCYTVGINKKTPWSSRYNKDREIISYGNRASVKLKLSWKTQTLNFRPLAMPFDTTDSHTTSAFHAKLPSLVTDF